MYSERMICVWPLISMPLLMIRRLPFDNIIILIFIIIYISSSSLFTSTMYPVISVPPSSSGGCQLTTQLSWNTFDTVQFFGCIEIGYPFFVAFFCCSGDITNQSFYWTICKFWYWSPSNLWCSTLMGVVQMWRPDDCFWQAGILACQAKPQPPHVTN